MKNTKTEVNQSSVAIYKSANGPILDVHLDKETVWLSQMEISQLYDKDRSVISRHIKQIFSDNEVNKKSNVHFLHTAKSDKPVAIFSLDVILAVGYRTNSSKAINFRKWATNILKKYILHGYALNQKRLFQTQNNLNDLQETILFLKNKASHKLMAGQESEILNLLASYSKTLTILSRHDKDKLRLVKKGKGKFYLDYSAVIKIISETKNELLNKKEASSFFGQENGNGLKAVLGAIFQTFDNHELYSSIEEKSANLLYLIIKDHPFVDGNKRLGSLLFVYFLNKNNYLYRPAGEKKINDTTLTALALLIAISNPKDKSKLIKLITNLL